MEAGIAFPSLSQIYDNGFTDNARWNAFRPRDGDIIISTPSKSGTTWMQAICAHLVFKSTEFYAPVGSISPWFDLVDEDLNFVLKRLDDQTHRRFIKTHTPLDGVPYFKNVTYVHVARNPLDVMFSMRNHMGNMTRELPGVDELDDLDALLNRWLNTGVRQWAEVGGQSMEYPFHHTKTFWDYRHLPNVHLFHYANMRQELPYQMKRLANLLGEVVPDELWPSLIHGVSLKNMKENAATFAPGVDADVWKDVTRFFHKGRQGEGMRRLSEAQIALYDAAANKFARPELRAWIERGEF